ncbi:hypothetical protein HDU77_009387 [Chytriomyces hyalinus]|nr:hypothetical protein HDU77_009387 [Chytriomyces hyalinus]
MGYTDKQMCRVTKHIQDKFPDHRYARLSSDSILMNQCRFNMVAPLFDDDEDVGMGASATFDMLAMPRPEEDEVAWVLEPIPEDAPYPAEPVGVIEIQWSKEDIAAATARLMDWKQDDWEEEDGKEDEEVDQEVEELRGEPIPEDAPYPAEPTVVATPWELEDMTAATALLLESDAWKQDVDWDMDRDEEDGEGEEGEIGLMDADNQDAMDWEGTEMDWEETDLLWIAVSGSWEGFKDVKVR